MPKRNLSLFAICACAFALSACSDSTPLKVASVGNQLAPISQQAQADEQEVNFDIKFSSLLGDPVSSTGSAADNRRQIFALAPEIMQGTVVAENIATGEITSSPLVVFLQNGNADSLTTLNFATGDYDLTFSFSKEGQFYIGQQFLNVTADNTNVVPVLISPVIGDTLVDVQTDTLIDLEFNIALDEINTANLTDPLLEVSLNGDFDLFFINPDTGLSQEMWLNLPPGNHSISVNLLDAGLIVGKSQTQIINVNGNDAITIDIEPLFGQVEYDIFVEGGPANVEVNVPAAVVDTAGGVDNLDAFLQVAAVDGSNFFAEPLILVSEGDDYKANVTIPDASYGLQTFDIDFFDLAKGEPIGNCFGESTLSVSNVTVSCQIQLQSQSLVSTSLLSAVSVNVLDSSGFPLPGATVSVDGDTVGITGDDINTSPGYANVFVKPGTHIIRADFNGEFGEVEYESTALSSANVVVILGQTVNNNAPLFDETFVLDPAQGLFPEDNFLFACAGASEFPGAVVETDFERLALPSYVLDCEDNSAVTQLNFDQAEIEVAGGFEVVLDMTSTADPDAELSIGIGEDPVGDPLFFNPSDSADAVLTVRDFEVEITTYDNGSPVTTTRPTPFTLSAVDALVFDVELATQLPGENGNLNVIVNGNPGFIESIPFIWDGGSNHIELRGSRTQAANGGTKVFVDRMTVRPR